MQPRRGCTPDGPWSPRGTAPAAGQPSLAARGNPGGVPPPPTRTPPARRPPGPPGGGWEGWGEGGEGGVILTARSRLGEGGRGGHPPKIPPKKGVQKTVHLREIRQKRVVFPGGQKMKRKFRGKTGDTELHGPCKRGYPKKTQFLPRGGPK